MTDNKKELAKQIKDKVAELNELIKQANTLNLTVFVSNDPMVTKAIVTIKEFAPTIEY